MGVLRDWGGGGGGGGGGKIGNGYLDYVTTSGQRDQIGNGYLDYVTRQKDY